MSAETIARLSRPQGLPFKINKIGHVALFVADVERSARFYVETLGFRVTDVYDSDMMPGGAVFLRCNTDHHGIALFPATQEKIAGAGLHHMAFEVSTLDEVVRVRNHLRACNVPIHFDGRRRAGVQIAVEFRDPDGHNLEIYWGIDQVGSEGQARPADQWKGANSLEAAIADPVLGQDTTLADPAALRAG
jgi:catechol 2,3-dioxygenase